MKTWYKVTAQLPNETRTWYEEGKSPEAVKDHTEFILRACRVEGIEIKVDEVRLRRDPSTSKLQFEQHQEDTP